MQPTAQPPVVRRDTSRRSGHDSTSRSRSQQPSQGRSPSVPAPAPRDPAAEQRARAAAKQRERDEWETTRGAGSDMLQRFPADHPSCSAMGTDSFDITEMLPTLDQVQAARFEPLQVPSADQLLQRGISEYTILPKILGRGKFSTVFLAVKKGSGSSGNAAAGVTTAPPDRSASSPSYYAIKHTPLFPHHALIATRLLREPTLLAELPPHPNLVAVYETVRTPDHFYLVEQYLGGYVTLEALLPMKAEQPPSPPQEQDGPATPRPITLPMEIAESVFGQLISAVRACHHPLQICHRDIKPENILVHPETLQLKLLDFGLATHFSKSEPKLSTCCGSPAFHCPEIVHALASPHGSVTYWGPEVDAWTCGVTMLRLLTGVRYPLGASHASLRSMSIRAQRALATIPDSPTHLRERVGRLLDMDSTKRMQALEEMAVQYEQEKGEPERIRKEFRSTTFIPTEPAHKMILPLLTGFAAEAAVMRPTLTAPSAPTWASSVPQTPLGGPSTLPSMMSHHASGTRTPHLSLSTANSRMGTPAGSRSASPAPPSTSTTSTSTTNASATPSSATSGTSAATSLHAHSQGSYRRSPSRPRLGSRVSSTAPTSPVQDPPQLPSDMRKSADTLRPENPAMNRPLVLLNPAKHPSQRLLSFIKYSLRCAGVLYHAWPDSSGIVHGALGNTAPTAYASASSGSGGAGGIHSPEFAAALTMLRETSGGAGPAISIPNTPADFQTPATPSFPFPDSYNSYAAQTSLAASGTRLDGYAHVHIFQCVVSLAALSTASEQQGGEGGSEESLSLVQTIMAAFGRRPAARRSSSQPSSKDGSHVGDRSPSSSRRNQGNAAAHNLLPEDRNKHLAFYLVVRFPRSGRASRDSILGAGGLASPRPQVVRSRSSTGLGSRQRAASMAGALVSQISNGGALNKSMSTRPSLDALRGSESRLRATSDAAVGTLEPAAPPSDTADALRDELHAKLAQAQVSVGSRASSSAGSSPRRNRPPSLSFTVASPENAGVQHSDPSLEVDKTPVVVATSIVEEKREAETPSSSPIRSRNVSRTRSSRHLNGTAPVHTGSQHFPRVSSRASAQMPRVYVQVSDERVREFLVKTLSVGGVTDTEDIVIEDGVVVNAPVVPERSGPETLLDRRRRAMGQRSQSYAPLSSAARRSIELSGGAMDPPARARHNRMSSYNAYVQGTVSGNESSESESPYQVRRGRQPGAAARPPSIAARGSRETQTDETPGGPAGVEPATVLKSGLGDAALQLQPTVTATSEDAHMPATTQSNSLSLPMDDPSYFPRAYNQAHALAHGARVAPSVLSAVPLNEETQSMLSTSASATASIRDGSGGASREGSGERPASVRRPSDAPVGGATDDEVKEVLNAELETRTPQPEMNLEQALQELKVNLDALSIGRTERAETRVQSGQTLTSATDRLVAVMHFFESAKHAEGTTRLSEALEPVLFELFEVVSPVLGLEANLMDLAGVARRTLELAAAEAQSPKEVLLAVQTRMEELMRNAGTPAVQDEEEVEAAAEGGGAGEESTPPSAPRESLGVPARPRQGSGDTILQAELEVAKPEAVRWSATVELVALLQLLCSVIPRIMSTKPRTLTQTMARMFPRTVRTVMANSVARQAPGAVDADGNAHTSCQVVPLFLAVCKLVDVLVMWLRTRAGSITGDDVEVRNVSFDILALFLGCVGALIPRLPSQTTDGDDVTSLAQAYFRISQPRFTVPRPPNGAAAPEKDDANLREAWDTLRRTTALLDVNLEKLAFERGTLDANVVGDKRGGSAVVLKTGSAVLQHEADVEGLSALVSLDAFLVHVNLLARDPAKPWEAWDGQRASAMLQTSMPLLLAAFGSNSMAPPVFDMAGSGAGRRLSGELDAFADAALVWVQWLLDAVARTDGATLPDSMLLTLVNVLGSHAALSPHASARMISYRCIATLIGSLAPEPVGLALLRDLITDAPYPRLRASCVGLVRELVAQRIDDAGPAGGVPGFATPALLLELGPSVFMLPSGAPAPRVPNNESERANAKETVKGYFQDFADMLVEACGVYYFLIKRDRLNRTGIRTSTTLATLDASFLLPLRAILDAWLPLFVSSRAEDGVAPPPDAHASAASAAGQEVLAVELTILADALERAEQARDDLKASGGVRS